MPIVTLGEIQEGAGILSTRDCQEECKDFIVITDALALSDSPACSRGIRGEIISILAKHEELLCTQGNPEIRRHCEERRSRVIHFLELTEE